MPHYAKTLRLQCDFSIVGGEVSRGDKGERLVETDRQTESKPSLCGHIVSV